MAINKAETEEEKTDIRIRLHHQIKDLVEWIKITPLKRDYTLYEEIEPGVVQTMDSKYIDHIYVKFRGLKKKSTILALRRESEEV